MLPITKELLENRTFCRQEDIRGCYYRDQTAIIHSRPFRRLKHKTQVFFSPDDDHVCTRIEHVLHVATIAATICRGLNLKYGKHNWNTFGGPWQGNAIYDGLNEDMAYSIGLGHDLGHTPFGHSGEEAITSLLRKEGYLNETQMFMHEVNGYRVVEKLSAHGKGLNLTYAVKDGIISHNGERFEQSIRPTLMVKDLDAIHSRSQMPSTWEGCIVRFSDKIAYLGRDIEDAMQAGFISRGDIPSDVLEKIGDGNGAIINHLILDLVDNSSPEKGICFSDESYSLMRQLKDFNYRYIYNHEKLLQYKRYCIHIIESLFHYLKNLHLQYGWDLEWYAREQNLKLDRAFGDYMASMEDFYKAEKEANMWNNGQLRTQIITDYIAGMTDNYAIECMREISLPKPIKFKRQ